MPYYLKPMNIPYACNPRSKHMLPLAFELLFQAQINFLGLQVKVSIIWKEHKERDKRFFGGFSLHLWVSFTIVVEHNKRFSMGNYFFIKFQTFKIWNFCETYFNFNSF
jgi:hypothetical protein